MLPPSRASKFTNELKYSFSDNLTLYNKQKKSMDIAKSSVQKQ